MLTEKEKLEEELKLLEESLSLNVITKQEYEDAKQRIESKSNELGPKVEEKPEVGEEGEIEEEPEPEVEKEVEKPKITEIKEENVKPVEDEKEEVTHESPKEEILKEKDVEPVKEDIGEEQKKLEEVKELSSESEKGLETREKQSFSVSQKSSISEKSETFQKAEEKPEVREEGEIKEVSKPEGEQPDSVIEGEKKSSKKIFTYIAIILFLVVGSWYLFFSGGSNDADAPIEAVDEPISLIACSSDGDCSKETGIGICNNPGTEDAECEYIEDVKVKLIVLNSNDCFNCDTGRILSILKKNFPNLDIKNTDFETEEGKSIIEKYNIKALPAYIFNSINSSFEEAYNYNKLSSGLREVKGDFVMKYTMANANYYIEREEIENKLDLFVMKGQNASIKAEENLKWFLDTFGKNVDFEKHSADSQIVKELGINSFPAFLINNKNKFSGVQSADKIRENFCQLNNVPECALGLAKSLV